MPCRMLCGVHIKANKGGWYLCPANKTDFCEGCYISLRQLVQSHINLRAKLGNQPNCVKPIGKLTFFR